MSRFPVEIDELLTGLIDGQLSTEERSLIESKLEGDAELRSQLQELKRIRDGLESIPNIKSPDFSKSIVALAKERAADQRLKIDWIEKATLSTRPRKSMWERYGHVLTTAAILSFVLVGGAIYYRSLINQPSSMQQIVAHVPQAEPSVKPNLDREPAVPENRVDSSAANSIADNAAPSRTIEQNDAPNTNSSVELDEVPDLNSTQGAMLADATKQDGLLEMAVENSLANLSNAKEIEAALDGAFEGFLVIVDVTVSKEVDSMEVLRDLMLRHDIAFGEDLNVNQKIVSSLEKSRLLDDVVSEQRKQQKVDNTAFVFVKGRAVRIDAAIEEIIRDVEAFPEFSFDIAVDAPGMELFDELRGVQEAELSPAESQQAFASIASPLRRNAENSKFFSTTRRQPSMPIEARIGPQGTISQGLTGESANPVSYVLFVVRTPVE